MDSFINVALMRNPFNWLIIIAMVALGNICAQYVMTAARTAKGA